MITEHEDDVDIGHKSPWVRTRPKVKVSYVQVTANQRPPEPLAKFCESVLRQKRLAPGPHRGHGTTHTARYNDRAGAVAFVAFVAGRRKVRVWLCICERWAKGEASRGHSLPKGAVEGKRVGIARSRDSIYPVHPG